MSNVNINAAPALPYVWDLLKNMLSGNQHESADAGEMPEYSAWVDPSTTRKLRTEVQTKKDTDEAKPYLSALSEYERSGIDQAFTPDEIAAGYDVKPNPQNPFMRDAATQFAKKQVIADIGPKALRGEDVDGTKLAQLFIDNKEGKDVVSKLIDLGKYNDDLRIKRGNQAWINASAELTDEPKLAALARAAQHGANPKDLETMAGIYGLNPVDLKTVQAGDAQGNDVQYLYNPRSGATVGTVGMPQAAGRNATRIVNNINPETMTAAAMKAFGPQVMNDTGKRYETASKTAALQNDYVNMYKLLQAGAPSGWGTEAQVEAKRIAKAAGVGNVDKLNNQQLLDAISKNMAAKAVRQTDANPTQKQIEMVMRTFPGLSREGAVNVAQTQLAIQANSRDIQSHNKRLEAFRTLPGGDALGGIMVQQYAVEDPASGLNLPTDPIKTMNRTSTVDRLPAKLPEGAQITDRATGKTYMIRGGRKVEVQRGR